MATYACRFASGLGVQFDSTILAELLSLYKILAVCWSPVNSHLNSSRDHSQSPVRFRVSVSNPSNDTRMLQYKTRACVLQVSVCVPCSCVLVGDFPSLSSHIAGQRAERSGSPTQSLLEAPLKNRIWFETQISHSHKKANTGCRSHCKIHATPMFVGYKGEVAG